jgi:hypothetical protein
MARRLGLIWNKERRTPNNELSHIYIHTLIISVQMSLSALPAGMPCCKIMTLIGGYLDFLRRLTIKEAGHFRSSNTNPQVDI